MRPRGPASQYHHTTKEERTLCSAPLLIVCYKRAKNIGDIVSQTSLFQNRGEEVSTYLGRAPD